MQKHCRIKSFRGGSNKIKKNAKLVKRKPPYKGIPTVTDVCLSVTFNSHWTNFTRYPLVY